MFDRGCIISHKYYQFNSFVADYYNMAIWVVKFSSRVYKMENIFPENQHTKEIVERRHGEAIKFLFLPKMGLFGSQAGNEKTAGGKL